MDLSIVVVNFNTREKLARCLESIAKSDLSDLATEVIVVDNHSTEYIGEMPQMSGISLALIKNDSNKGMGAGNNVGIKQAIGEFILVLNPDTGLASDAIRHMVIYLKLHDAVGVVGPKLIYPDGSPQASCFHYPNIFLPLLRRTFFGKLAPIQLAHFMMTDSDLRIPQSVDWVMGSCMMFAKKVLDQVGLFDERFFMYFEDTDLCRRITCAGFGVVYLPEAVVTHHHGRASAKEHWYVSPFINKMSRIHIASWLKYFWKWRQGRA
ncbi:MAG: glycosyltransferase family 2 protein [Candidatus Falkowbacteria bacterium]